MKTRALNLLLQHQTLFALAIILSLTFAAPARATVISTFVDTDMGGSGYSGGGAQYDFASATMNIDPTNTNWIAWADFWSLQTDPQPYSYSGGQFVGSHGFGTDDWIQLTITNPGGATASLQMDYNNSIGTSIGYGPQMIILGEAADAPDVRRYNIYGSGGFINEAGAFNSSGIFNSIGQYTFDFSFRNQWTSNAGHPYIYLLADVNQAQVVPEPATMILLGVGLVGLAGATRRKLKK